MLTEFPLEDSLCRVDFKQLDQAANWQVILQVDPSDLKNLQIGRLLSLILTNLKKLTIGSLVNIARAPT
jgi:hypothetical protein